jgi:hypothetical protein
LIIASAVAEIAQLIIKITGGFARNAREISIQARLIDIFMADRAGFTRSSKLSGTLVGVGCVAFAKLKTRNNIIIIENFI